MKVLELNHVAIHVSDVERSSRFYGEELGFAPIPRPAFDFPGAWFRLGSHQELHLIGGRFSGLITGRNRPGHFALQVADVDEVERRLKERGIKHARQRRPDGARQIFIEDPDGHLIEFCDQLPDGPAA
jgi:lactoylglutathione lyase